jgi:NADPH-dependent curcumin reductase
VLFARRPSGVPQPEDIQLAPTGIPKLRSNSTIVQNVYLSVDPAQRGGVSAEANYSSPMPMGAPMRALAVGVVVESDHPELSVGEWLYGWFG